MFDDSAMSADREFHSAILEGKNECLYDSILADGTSMMATYWIWWCSLCQHVAGRNVENVVNNFIQCY